MYQMIVNQEYGIIESIFKYTISDPEMSKFLRIKSNTTSIIPGGITYDVTLDEVPNDVFQMPRAYIYDNQEFKICPFIYVDVLNKDEVVRYTSRDEPYMLLGKEVEFIVKYMDPDNYQFDRYFDEVKLKDRYGHLHKIPSRFKLDPDTKEYRFSTSSNFPGVAKLRAKDTSYLCNFFPIMMRFKDG